MKMWASMMMELNPIPTLLSNNTRAVAFTTPQNYAGRVSHLLQLKGWTPLWCPTLLVEPSPHTKASLQFFLSTSNDNSISRLEDFSAIAFTSRTGILAFSETLIGTTETPLLPHGESFTVSALGKDAELLDKEFLAKLCRDPRRIEVTVPPVATPTGLVESLGLGRGRRILCPVPLVVGIAEPPVVPNFLRDLASKDWVPVKVHAYETRWAGTGCAEALVRRMEGEEGLDAIVFTSIGEVEGLLKSLREDGLDWGMVKRRCPGLVVAAHGPVTAAGAERLGITVDVVSSRFHSFDGVVESLALRWSASH